MYKANCFEEAFTKSIHEEQCDLRHSLYICNHQHHRHCHQHHTQVTDSKRVRLKWTSKQRSNDQPFNHLWLSWFHSSLCLHEAIDVDWIKEIFNICLPLVDDHLFVFHGCTQCLRFEGKCVGTSDTMFTLISRSTCVTRRRGLCDEVKSSKRPKYTAAVTLSDVELITVAQWNDRALKVVTSTWWWVRSVYRPSELWVEDDENAQHLRQWDCTMHRIGWLTDGIIWTRTKFLKCSLVFTLSLKGYCMVYCFSLHNFRTLPRALMSCSKEFRGNFCHSSSPAISTLVTPWAVTHCHSCLIDTFDIDCLISEQVREEWNGNEWKKESRHCRKTWLNVHNDHQEIMCSIRVRFINLSDWRQRGNNGTNKPPINSWAGNLSKSDTGISNYFNLLRVECKRRVARDQ